MEFLRIRKVLNSIYNEEIKENLKAIKSAKKLYFDGWSSEYTTTEDKQNLKYIKGALKGADVRGVFGYGLHFYKICGAFDGGVGIKCHVNILEKLNYKCLAQHDSKYNDYLKFELKTHKRG